MLELIVNRQALLLALVLLPTAGSAVAAPSISLTFPDLDRGVSIESGSSVATPAEDISRFEFRIDNAFSDIQAATVRVTLNAIALTIFSRVNRLPTGARVLVDLTRSLNEEHRFRVSESNTLTLEARDEAGNRYSGVFEVFPRSSPTMEMSVFPPRNSGSPVFSPKERFSEPKISFQEGLPSTTADEYFTVAAEIEDEYGLREVAIDVNGKIVDTVIIENDSPIRRRGTFTTLKDLPGRVGGTGAHLTVEIPVKLKKSMNVVAIRAVNAKGIRGRATWTVTRLKDR